MGSIFKKKEANIILVMIVLSILISLRSEAYFSVENFIDIFKSNTVLAILSMGMLMAIITGGIDVSIAATTVAVTVITGKLMVNFDMNIVTVIITAAVCGIILGAINGFFISKFRIPPIVVTLGTLSIYRGLTLFFTNGRWITNIPLWFQDFGDIKPLGLPIQLYFLLGVALLSHIILNYTILGRGIYAIGGNPEATNRVGFKKERIELFIYSYIGFVSGIAAVVHSSIVKMVDPGALSGFEMEVVAAVVLGGANILGGEGSVGGALLGVLMLGTINNGLILARIPTYWQQIIVGFIILAAVSFDVLQRKRIERSMLKIDVE